MSLQICWQATQGPAVALQSSRPVVVGWTTLSLADAVLDVLLQDGQRCKLCNW